LKTSHLNPINVDSLPGEDDIHRLQLENGVLLLVRRNEYSQSVVLSGYLPCGSVFDPQEKLGLAYFTASMLMRGTQKRTFQQIYDDLETTGASLGFGTSVHNVSFSGRSLAEDLPVIINLLNETLRSPSFDANQVERLRAQLLTGLAIRAQDTANMADLKFDEMLFAGHPYARPEDGYPETIHAITREDIQEFHQKHYGPMGMVIVVVGAVTPELVFDLMRNAFGDWSNPKQPPTPEMPTITPRESETRLHIPLPGKTQVDVLMGVLGPRRNDPDYIAASLGNNILGQFGMMGRIGGAVRERAGLAYYASTSLNGWISAGSWEISAGVNPANVEKAIEIIRNEVNRFISEPVSQEELLDSQANYIGRLPLSFESNSGVASGLLNIERFKLGLDYFRKYPSIINEVSPHEVLETARRYIDPERFLIVSCGPEPL
jgi:zinc protease